MPKVLVLGVCLCDRPNNAERIIAVLRGAARHHVTQRWIGLGVGRPGRLLQAAAQSLNRTPAPKYELVNELLAAEDLSQYEYVVVVDDDIALPDRFLDDFLTLQAKFDLRLAQPARTANSYIDHPIVKRVDRVLARETLFVESGPVVSFHRSIFDLAFPCDMTSPMGWGYENVWAYRLSRRGLRMGIVDACPVEHRLRRTGTYYDRDEAHQARARLLAGQPHLSLEKCYATLRVFRTLPSDAEMAQRSKALSARSPLGVNVSGYLASEKGVGEAVRADIRALEAARIPYVLNNVTDPASVNREMAAHHFSDENPYSVNLIHVNADTIHHFVRKIGPQYFAGHYNIGFWAWELSEFPAQWQARFEHLHEIWTPSSFVQQTLARCSPAPVWTIPHCIDVEPRPLARSREDFGLPERSFVFLFAFDYDSCATRKNPLGLIRAFRKAFTPAEDAILVLKCSHAERRPEELESLRTEAGGARIHIIDRVLSRADMHDLMGLADCYVSLHRSEGFGLTLAEAMALAKPVIATGYSGNLDFMTSGNSYLVPSRLVEIREDVGYYERGCSWAEPDLDEAARLMRFVFENRDEAAATGLRAREDIVRKLHPSVVGAIIKERLQDIAARHLTRAREIDVSPALDNSRTAVAGTAAAPPECSIVIPVHNNAVLTRQCLDSLLSAPAAIPCEVIVVDDASTDATAEVLRRYGKKLRVLTRRVNSGFASACNEGAALASGEFLVFLNNDTIPQRDWLDALVRYALQHPKVGIVGSKLLFPDGTVQHAGVVVGPNGYPRHIYSRFSADHPAVNRSRRFQAVTGACMLMRRALFQDLGGFDTAFKNGFEDIDLCFRAGRRGFEIHYCHESVLTHLQSATRGVRKEEESRNCEVYRTRWGRVRPDEAWHHQQDGLPPGRHRPVNPFAAAISPRLPPVRRAEARRSPGVASLDIDVESARAEQVLPRRAPPMA